MSFVKDESESCVYFEQIKKIPLLTPEEEVELSRLIQKGDQKARSRLIEANLRLVIKIARSCLVKDIALMDLIQEGNMGLMRAADKFDYGKDVRFSTYAGWWIRQSIVRYLCNNRRTIRLPLRKEGILRKIQHLYCSLSQENMRQPKNAEIASEIGIPLEEVESVLNMTSGIISFGYDGEGIGSGTMNTHEDYTYCPERALMRQSLKDETQKVLKRLKSRERRILIYRYQLNGGERHSLEKIGNTMGISQETVRQIEKKALTKIRSDADDLYIYYGNR